MNTSQLIRKRRSVRTFDGKPLREEDAAKIMEYAAALENPFGIAIEWKLLDRVRDGLSSPVITGTDAFIGGKMKRLPRAEEAFGYTFEKLVLLAESLGVGTTWIAGTMDRKAFERAMDLSEDEVMPCVSPLGYPAAKMSLRESMMRKGIKADSRLPFGELFFDGSFDKPLSPEAAGDLKLAFEMVRLAPSAVNRQPWRVVLSGGKAHFYEKDPADEGAWDIRKVDMGIALCHFELGATESGIRTALETEDPGIPAPADLRYIATLTLC